MKNSFIIHWDSGSSEHFICPCCHDRKIKDKEIPVYYSYRHAGENGWRHTKDIRYCPPEQTLGVWVCPECLKS